MRRLAMSILIPTVKRNEAKLLKDLREQGFTYAQIAKRLGRSRMSVARYDRIYDRFGIEAFAK